MTNLLKCVQAIFLLVASFGLSSCDVIFEPFHLRDIGPLYNESEEAFAELLVSYPGPYDGGLRIHLAQSKEEETGGRPYIEGLSGATRYQRIETPLFSDADGGYLKVVLRQLTIGDGFQLGAVHFHRDDPQMLETDESTKVVEGCDDEAEASLAAFTAGRNGGSFYCRLSDEWYGFFYWSE